MCDWGLTIAKVWLEHEDDEMADRRDSADEKKKRDQSTRIKMHRGTWFQQREEEEEVVVVVEVEEGKWCGDEVEAVVVVVGERRRCSNRHSIDNFKVLFSGLIGGQPHGLVSLRPVPVAPSQPGQLLAAVNPVSPLPPQKSGWCRSLEDATRDRERPFLGPPCSTRAPTFFFTLVVASFSLWWDSCYSCLFSVARGVVSITTTQVEDRK